MAITQARKIDVYPDCGGIRAVWLYGSAARGDADPDSDVDVLILLDDADSCVKHRVALFVNEKREFVETAGYTIDVMNGLIESGSLFAWHLLREGEPLIDNEGLLAEMLTRLQPYRGYRKDLEILADLLDDAVASSRGGLTATYDAAVLATVCRNVALLVSQADGHLDFRPIAPTRMADHARVPFPLSEVEYELLRRCKRAAERGSEDPFIGSEEVMHLGGRLKTWLRDVRSYLRLT